MDRKSHDRKNHRVLDSQPLRGHPGDPGRGDLGRACRHQHAGRCHPRPVGEPGDRLHRLDGPQPQGDRGPDHLSAFGELAGAGGREGGAVLQRVQLLDDQRDLRRQRRFLLRPATGVGAAHPGQHFPAAGRGALSGPRCHGPGADLLVHGRRRRAGPGPAPRDPGLVRPLPTQFGPRRGPGGLGRRIADRVPDRRRPQQTPRLQRDPGRVVRGRRAVQFVGRRQGDPERQRRVHRPRRRLDREHPGHREDRRQGRPGEGHARSACPISAR